MSRVLIDDDYFIVESARRWDKALRVIAVCSVVALVGGVLSAGVAGSVAPLAVLPIAAICLVDSRSALANVVVGRIDVRCGSVDFGADGMVIRHPIATQPIDLPYAALASFDVSMKTPQNRRAAHGYEIFPIERPAGSLHPLDEPTAFLGDTQTSRGKSSVALASIDLGRRMPNVVLNLRDALSMEMRSPPWATERGWIPTDEFRGGRTFSAITAHLERRLRTLTPTGLYLRVDDPAQLAATLERLGVRRGLGCTDWIQATGLPHPDLPCHS